MFSKGSITIHYVELGVCTKIKLFMFCKRRMRLLDFHCFLNAGYDYCEFMLVFIWKKDLFSKHIMLSFTLLAHSRDLCRIFGNYMKLSAT